MAYRTDPEYVRKLEETISKFMSPLRDIPFPIAIRALTGYEVIPFNPNDLSDAELLKALTQAAQKAGERAFQEGIFARRPNEAGNAIEPFVTDALRELGLRAEVPRTQAGIRRSAGYPDREIVFAGHTPTYLDCKVYSTETKAQTFRTFYMSPSDNPKITKDAHHLLLSYELTRQTREGRQAFVPISWQLYTLDNLSVQVKHEFNASNRDLYREEYLLAEGTISP